MSIKYSYGYYISIPIVLLNLNPRNVDFKTPNIITNGHFQNTIYLCIFTVKSVTKYYTKENSPVYTCFLDANKDIRQN